MIRDLDQEQLDFVVLKRPTVQIDFGGSITGRTTLYSQRYHIVFLSYFYAESPYKNRKLPKLVVSPTYDQITING